MTPTLVSGLLDSFLSTIPGGKIGIVSKPGTDVPVLNIVQSGSRGTQVNPAAPKGVNVPGAKPLSTASPQPNKVSVWENFWYHFYRIPGTSKAADTIIKAGDTIRKTEAAVGEGAKDVVQGVKIGVT